MVAATERQVNAIKSLLGDEEYLPLWLKVMGISSLEELSKERASALIDLLVRARKALAGLDRVKVAKECMKRGLEVAEILPGDVSADKKAEMAGRWAITFYLDARRFTRPKKGGREYE